MAQASLGNELHHRLRPGRRRRRRPAAARPDLGARVRRLPPGQPRPRGRPGRWSAPAAAASCSIDASGTVKLRPAAPAQHGGHGGPDRQHPGRRGVRPRSASTWRSPRRTPTSAPASGRSASTSGPRRTPGSFHAGFGVDGHRLGTTARQPSIARLLHRGLRPSPSTTAAPTARRPPTSSAPSSRSTSADAEPVLHLTVVTTLGDGDDLADVFGGASTEVDAPDQLQTILDGKPVQVRHAGRGPQAVPVLRRGRRCGPRPTTARCPSSARTSRPAPTSWARPGRRSTTSSRRTATSSRSVRPAAYLTKTLATELDILVNGADGIHVDFTCNSYLEPPADLAVTPTTATPARGDHARSTSTRSSRPTRTQGRHARLRRPRRPTRPPP